MCKTGDLWQKVWLAILAKGPDAIAVTKMKGHAKEEHIAQGITTINDEYGNDEADAVVDQAVRNHARGMVNASVWFAAKIVAR